MTTRVYVVGAGEPKWKTEEQKRKAKDARNDKIALAFLIIMVTGMVVTFIMAPTQIDTKTEGRTNMTKWNVVRYPDYTHHTTLARLAHLSNHFQIPCDHASVPAMSLLLRRFSETN